MGEIAGVRDIASVMEVEPLKVDRGSVAVTKGDGEKEMGEEKEVVGQYEGVKGAEGEKDIAGVSVPH